MMPDPEFVCYHCGAPSEIEAVLAQGVTKFKNCARCGKIGIRRTNDLYQQIYTKKPFREPYERSRYRGGRLVED